MAVIPKSNSEKRLVENLDCVGFDLSEEDLKAISKLNINLRVCLFLYRFTEVTDQFHSSQLNNPADIDPRLAIFA